MKFFLVVSALVAAVAVVQGAQVKPEPKWGWSIPLPFLNPAFQPPPPTTKPPVMTTRAPMTTTRAPMTTTKAPATTTTKATTAAPTTLAPETSNPSEPGQLSEEDLQAVAELFEMLPELEGRENEIFNTKPEGPNPLDATFDTLPANLQEVIKTLIALIESGKPLDLNAPLEVEG